jgi:hypothetical protein
VQTCRSSASNRDPGRISVHSESSSDPRTGAKPGRTTATARVSRSRQSKSARARTSTSDEVRETERSHTRYTLSPSGVMEAMSIETTSAVSENTSVHLVSSCAPAREAQSASATESTIATFILIARPILSAGSWTWGTSKGARGSGPTLGS